jgi:hypothetical protein
MSTNQTVLHKISTIIHNLVEIIISPRKLLLFQFNPFGLQTFFKSIILLLICYITTIFIYYGSINIIIAPISSANATKRTPNNSSYYIADQYHEFINSTYVLFGYSPNPKVVPKNAPTPLQEQDVDKQSAEQARANFNIIILQISGWLLLICIIIIISKMANTKWFTPA